MRGSMLSLSTNGGDNLSVSSSSQSHSQLQVNEYENIVHFALLQVTLIKSDAYFCQFSHDTMTVQNMYTTRISNIQSVFEF